MVPVVVVGLQSVHDHGHSHTPRYRHAEERDEHPPLLLPLLGWEVVRHTGESTMRDVKLYSLSVTVIAGD